jgi:hypothetical protein
VQSPLISLEPQHRTGEAPPPLFAFSFSVKLEVDISF